VAKKSPNEVNIPRDFKKMMKNIVDNILYRNVRHVDLVQLDPTIFHIISYNSKTKTKKGEYTKSYPINEILGEGELLDRNQATDVFSIGYCAVNLSQGATVRHGEGSPLPPVTQPHLFSLFWVYLPNEVNVCAYGSVANLFYILGAHEEAKRLKNERMTFIGRDPVRAIREGISRKGTRCLRGPCSSLDQVISYDDIDNYQRNTKFPVFLEMRGYRGARCHCVCIFRDQIIDGNYHNSLPFNIENLNWCLGDGDSYQTCIHIFQIIPTKAIRVNYEGKNQYNFYEKRLVD
jgi:hypothetical protein